MATHGDRVIAGSLVCERMCWRTCEYASCARSVVAIWVAYVCRNDAGISRVAYLAGSSSCLTNSRYKKLDGDLWSKQGAQLNAFKDGFSRF